MGANRTSNFNSGTDLLVMKILPKAYIEYFLIWWKEFHWNYIFTFHHFLQKKGSHYVMWQTHLLSVVGCVGQHCRDMKHQLKVFIGGVERVCASGVRCTEDEIIITHIIPLTHTHKISFLCGFMCTHLQMAHLWRDYEELCVAYIPKLTKNNWGISRTHFKNEPHLAKQRKRIIRTLHVMWNIKKEALTFVVQLCPELCKALETDLLTQQFEKLVQCGTTALIVVHLFLCALARLAVQDAHLVLVA